MRTKSYNSMKKGNFFAGCWQRPNWSRVCWETLINDSWEGIRHPQISVTWGEITRSGILIEIKGFLFVKNFLLIFEVSKAIVFVKISHGAFEHNRYSNSEKHCMLSYISNAGVSRVFDFASVLKWPIRKTGQWVLHPFPLDSKTFIIVTV